ncbi:hypothetical protein CORC01_13110, partial [Colletotrichum orchidophilum]
LNITLYSLLKRIYKDKINLFIKYFINYIIKSEFFITFYKVYNKIFLNKNIKFVFYKVKILL